MVHAINIQRALPQDLAYNYNKSDMYSQRIDPGFFSNPEIPGFRSSNPGILEL